jgi:hypothetical protein
MNATDIEKALPILVLIHYELRCYGFISAPMVKNAVPKHSQAADWARLRGIPEVECWMELAVCFRRRYRCWNFGLGILF